MHDLQDLINQFENVAEELLKYGGGGNDDSGKGAKVILATVPSSKAMSSALGGLAVQWKTHCYRCF